jgi:DNA (cytosine-5)-methyltransferase 1
MMQSGSLWLLPTLERGTRENGSSLWLTPSVLDISERSEASMEKRKAWREQSGRKTVPPGNLAEQVKYGHPIRDMWPTPQAMDARSDIRTRDELSPAARRGGCSNLREEVLRRLLPTPRANERQQKNSRNSSVALSKAVLLPTPSAREPGWKNTEVVDKDGNPPAHAHQRFYNKKTGQIVQKGLAQVARMFPTPRANENDQGPKNREKILQEGSSWKGQRRGATLSTIVKIFPTPTVNGNNNQKGMSEKSGDGLATFVRKFPTPTAPRPHDSENTVGRMLPGQKQQDLQQVVAKDGGQLNPAWVEWLMGFPIGWTELNASEMPSSRKSRKQSAKRS